MASRAFRSDFRTKAHRLLASSSLDDLFETGEGTTADEENVAGIDLKKFLLRVLAPAFRVTRHCSFDDFQESLLNPSPDTSRVMDGFSLFRAILSISSI